MTSGIVSRTSARAGATTRPRVTWQSAHYGASLAVLLAIVLWRVSLRSVDLTRMNDFGLISVLPPLYFLACFLLIGSFLLLVRRDPASTGLILLHLVALIVILYGVTAIVEAVPRYEVNWRNIGYSEYIMRTGTVAAELDPYYNWPGFFVLVAMIAQVAGYHSASVLIAWAPTVFNLLYLVPLVVIFRAATGDRRIVWLATWLFYLLNWIGQDYLAPQALSYFFFLVILAILLRWFKAAVADPREPVTGPLGLLARRLPRLRAYLVPADAPNAPVAPWQRVGLMAVLIVIYAAMSGSHQLSPFFTLAVTAALVSCERVTPRWLPVLMLVIALTWVSFMAVPFLEGQRSYIVGDAGNVSTIVGDNVTSRLQGSRGHLLVTYVRTGTTLLLWGLAALGGLRRLRHGRWDLTCALVAIAPFPFLASQSYGGEMLQRVYLFGLPATLFFAAALFHTTPAIGRSRWTTALIGALCVALVGAFLTARYGNERMDYVTSGELDAVRYMYSVAPPGSLLLAGTFNIPWRYQDHESYRYKTLKPTPSNWVPGTVDPDQEAVPANVAAVMEAMGNPRYPTTYLIITRAQKAHEEMFGVLPPGTLEELERDLVARGLLKVAYANEDATVLTLPGNMQGVWR